MDKTQLKLCLIPLGAGTHQVITVPSGTQLLDIIIHDRIPHIVALEGLGKIEEEINISMLRIGQKLPSNRGYRYLGTLNIVGRGTPFYFIYH